MLQSKLFLKTKKEDPSGEEAINAKLLLRAQYIDKLMAGVYSMLPLGLRVKRKIENIIREEMNSIGGQEILMPALHPKSIWDVTGRWEELEGSMYKLKDSHGKDMGLGFTHEEVIAEMAKIFIESYNDLPTYLYQIQTKFRDEERAKSGLLRGREFTMKDLYSFSPNEEMLDEFYEKAKDAYLRIFNRVGLGDITYLTFASGGVFSKYSHEFQTLSSVGEDVIYLCSNCRVAVNKEIIKDQDSCPICKSADLEEKTSIEVGNIFKLGTRFSEASGLKFKDDKGKLLPVVMGSYGIGVERLMGTIVEVFSDDKGIVWPSSVAPFDIHLVSISGSDDDLKTTSMNVYNELISGDIEVLFDDRDINPGAKFADSDLLGIPFRVVISKKTLVENSVEIKRRDSEDMELIPIENIISYLKKEIPKN